jgi:hypothetical protein
MNLSDGNSFIVLKPDRLAQHPLPERCNARVRGRLLRINQKMNIISRHFYAEREGLDEAVFGQIARDHDKIRQRRCLARAGPVSSRRP